MNAASSNTCLNCDAKNDSGFKYCANCGQKNTDGKIRFSQLWSEFLNAVFNIESKSWRTFKNIFIPGKLTLEYFSGKHQSYVHPLRLLLISAIPVILAMSFQDFQSATNHRYNIKELILKNYERKNLYDILGNITDNTNANFPSQQTEIITDTILTTFLDSMRSMNFENAHRDGYGDSLNLNKYASFGYEDSEIVSKYDFLNKDEDELAEMYKKDAGRFDRLIFKQKAKHIKDESQLMSAILGHTTWAALLMMPCLALVLYLLNIRRNYYYVEHLIFTFHLHAFAFLMIAVYITGINVFPEWVFILSLAAIGIYVFVSMLKVYRQSILMTLLKFLVLCISYLGLFFVFLVSTIFINFLLI